MKKIKLELKEKSVLQKIADGEEIAPQLIADANAQVQAVGAALDSATTVLNTKSTEQKQKEADAIAATEALNTQETVYDDAMRDASAKVMEIYKGDIQKWKDFGFQIGEESAPVGIPPKVENLSVTTTETSGNADLHWDSVAKVNGYKIQFLESEAAPAALAAPPPPSESGWKPATPDFSTKSKITATGLTAGKFISFRVAAVNSAGTGAWSNPVGRIIS